ncbi:MAG TPA: hypothetical protein VK831_02180 [Candidatus Deferrimicrobiaceae bacterium]|nr:hypothetical protein [Candidatus Deferrimicrobiaceae bacterium]
MASPESSRARRFALPELADERAGHVIEAFLDGRHARRGRPAPVDDAVPAPANPLVALVSRLDWNEALRRESARGRRYRRHAAIVVLAARPAIGTIDGAPPPDHVTEWLRRVAGPVAHVLRRGVRATDLVTRIGEVRFQLLLPESSERAATVLAERLIADCEVWLSAAGAPVTLEAAVTGLARDEAPEAAVARAWQLLDQGPAGADD